MTLADAIEIVHNYTDKPVDESTNLSDLGMDSLEFVELLLQFPNVPDQKVPEIQTVQDLWLAQEGKF